MPVVVDFDQQIGEPQRVPGSGWAVPCDVVGLTILPVEEQVKCVVGIMRLFYRDVGEIGHAFGLKFIESPKILAIKIFKAINRNIPYQLNNMSIIFSFLLCQILWWNLKAIVIPVFTETVRYFFPVRFHPSVIELSQLSEHLASSATRDALKFLDALLDDSDWTRHAVKPVDPRIGYLERIARFLHMRQPTISFTSRR
ncbi:unnamed protein product [Strongylus vulgaris]|uniref:Uncharacterized protein n=1 Tax=Strongylus vulgaris TaxID=40348 RepID=A0A3P7LTI1_STRVU|nr:unnamed protein product [Strongylus vulgaris]